MSADQSYVALPQFSRVGLTKIVGGGFAEDGGAGCVRDELELFCQNLIFDETLFRKAVTHQFR